MSDQHIGSVVCIDTSNVDLRSCLLAAGIILSEILPFISGTASNGIFHGLSIVFRRLTGSRRATPQAGPSSDTTDDDASGDDSAFDDDQILGGQHHQHSE